MSPFLFAGTGFQSANIPLRASLAAPNKRGPAGKAVNGVLKLHFADGLHGYQNPPYGRFEIPVKVALVSGGKLISVTYPKGVRMKVAGATTAVYSGDVDIKVSIRPLKKHQPVVLMVSYQQCNESACFPPAEVTVKGVLDSGR